MKPFDALVCRRTIERASAMLDGRLDARTRALVQEHLRECAVCTKAVQQTARLARATHNLPQHRASSGLADRVRAGLEARRSGGLADLDAEPKRVAVGAKAVRAAAAVVVIGLAWSSGFFVRGAMERGAAEQSPPPSQVASAPSVQVALPARSGAPSPNAASTSPSNALAPRPHVTPDATFASTTRRVLSDLAWMPQLPQNARQPLLLAQFDLFDLRRRAAHVLEQSAPDSAEHELARLVADLATTLEDQPDLVVEPVAQATHRLANADAAAPAPDLAAVRRVVDRHADSLTLAERDDLGQFLEFKRELVLRGGSVDRGFVQTFTTRTGKGATSFALATGFAGARDLADAGQGEAAAELERMLHEMLRAMQPVRRP